MGSAAMNVLLNLELEDRHIRQIGAASRDVAVVQLKSEDEILEAMPEIDVLFGELSEEMLRRADNLKWVQVIGAGVLLREQVPT